MSSSDPSTPPIPIRIANKTAYVWDVDDITTIRSKHHICGVLTGTLPHLSQQNVFLGVPLVLMPEEVALLVDIGAAHLIDDPLAFSHPPTPAQLTTWAAEQNESMKTQLAYSETKSSANANSGKAMSEEALRKRKEREEKKKAQAAAKAAAEAEEGLNLEDVPPVSIPERTSTPDPTSSIPQYTIIIPASASAQPWYSASSSTFDPSCTYTTLASAREAGIWDYPSTLAERARCGVFKDLWKQGYFMGGGIKFGGEYLVYPGDPLRYHSHFAATVIESPIAALRPMEIVAHGRLGTATKKAHLLCGWDDDKEEVSYLSIEWAGFG